METIAKKERTAQPTRTLFMDPTPAIAECGPAAGIEEQDSILKTQLIGNCDSGLIV
jgi:hypothetical protein